MKVVFISYTPEVVLTNSIFPVSFNNMNKSKATSVLKVMFT